MWVKAWSPDCIQASFSCGWRAWDGIGKFGLASGGGAEFAGMHGLAQVVVAKVVRVRTTAPSCSAWAKRGESCQQLAVLASKVTSMTCLDTCPLRDGVQIRLPSQDSVA